MAVNKPYRRTWRQFMDDPDIISKKFLLHKKFANNPRHYIRSFLILEQDIDDLFNYVEPTDINRHTYSHRIQQLLMRACVEIEANLTAILKENGYSKRGNLTMNDYKLVNHSHRLSSYSIRLPGWEGEYQIRQPFIAWEKNESLAWYKAYNESKHDRQLNFNRATFDNLDDPFNEFDYSSYIDK